MKVVVKKGDRKKKLLKGMVVALVRIEYDHYYNGRVEPHAILQVDKSEIRYPMMFLEFASDTEKTMEKINDSSLKK
jgi:hypothetical protein